jgi:hypothetical protein
VGSDAACAARNPVLKITAFSPKRNLSYESPPTSLRHDFRSLRRAGDGLWLSKGQVRLLGGDAGPPRAGRHPVSLTIWFETLATAETLADEYLSDSDEGLDDDVEPPARLEPLPAPVDPEAARLARKIDVMNDANRQLREASGLEGALAPLHVSAAAEPPADEMDAGKGG